jgi:glycosyltransferase involved in cell wall biosynthesis
MVTYNHLNFIEQAIESVLMQETDFDYELVIGEDCSTDGTREIVKSYAEKYPNRIRALLHPHNLGMQQNFVRVLEACQGTYIALLEGDDYWTDSLKLQKQVDFLEANPDFSICFHKIKILEDNKLKDDYITTVPAEITTIEDLAKGNYIHTPSCIFRNRGLEIIGEHFQYSPIGDYYLHMMNAQFGKLFSMNDTMSVYRVHNDGCWSKKSQVERIIKTLQALQCIFLDLKNRTPEVNTEIINLHFRYLVDLYTTYPVSQNVNFSMIRLDYLDDYSVNNIYIVKMFDVFKTTLIANNDIMQNMNKLTNQNNSIKFLSKKLFHEIIKRLIRIGQKN